MLKRLLFAVLLAISFAAQAVVYSLPWGPRPQFVDANGAPMSSGTLTFYRAGSTTPQNTYTDSTGGVANSNPITLNTRGESPNEVWLTGSVSYKMVLKDSSGVTVWTVDNISGINDTSVSLDQWVSGATPTYISATSFSLVGDQTTTYQVGRRLKSTNSGGTIYSRISASVFGAVTTITVVNDSGTLDSGLSAVSYGLLSATNPSFPAIIDGGTSVTVTYPSGRPTVAIAANAALPRSYLAGLGLSNNGSDATNDIDIAIGVARDSTDVFSLSCAAQTKRLDANWVAGTNQGFRNSAAAITDTTYHIYAVATASGTCDYYAHTSAVVATMLAALQIESGGSSYVYARRIGSIVRASAAIRAFIQTGDEFIWKAGMVQDVNVTNPGTSAVTRTLSVPSGIVVWALIVGQIDAVTSTSLRWLLTPLDIDDVASTNAQVTFYVTEGAGNDVGSGGPARVKTNTSAQIRSRAETSGATDGFRINTYGWIDRRGKDE